MKKINMAQMVAIVAVAGALATSAVLAGDKPKKVAAPAPAAKSTLPTFANVKVVSGTPQQIARAAQVDAAAQSEGMRAYVDSAGNLRPGTADDFAAEAATAPQARAAARSSARSAFSAEANMSVSEDGTMSLELDESHMSYSIASIQPDGTVKEVCVTGIDAAVAAVNSPAQPEVHSHEK